MLAHFYQRCPLTLPSPRWGEEERNFEASQLEVLLSLRGERRVRGQRGQKNAAFNTAYGFNNGTWLTDRLHRARL